MFTPANYQHGYAKRKLEAYRYRQVSHTNIELLKLHPQSTVVSYLACCQIEPV